MEAMQIDLMGMPHPATGNWLLDQVAIILEKYPEAQDNNTWLRVRWLQEYKGCELDETQLYAALDAEGKVDLARRRRELAAQYPGKYAYSGAEAGRRKHLAKAGSPGRRR